MFARDHTKALAAGAAVAAKLGIAPPEGVNPKQQATLDALARIKGRPGPSRSSRCRWCRSTWVS